MLALKIHNEFLDLPADIGVELERNNPFLSDDIQGEFSLGLTIRYSEKNYRLLQYSGNFYKKNEKYTVDAEIYDDGLYRYSGKLVINQHQANMNEIEETIWTGFFTIGASSFLQEIQDVLLQDVDLGGVRSFPWTTADPDDGSGGFFQHIHHARTPNAFPYCFYPIYNEGWSTTDNCKWMNKLEGSNYFQLPVNDSYPDMREGNAISLCPAIYLSFLLEKIFANFGWKLSGDLLNDVGYKKVTIPSFRAIIWVGFGKYFMGSYWVFGYANTVHFDLADHVPPDITIGSFFVSLKNRMGWYFDFDSNTKTATLRANKSFLQSPVKNWTSFAQAAYTSEYPDVAKKYSLINNIDSSDTYPVIKTIDEDNVIRVADAASLPAPTEDNDGAIAFALFENNYYTCKPNDGTSSYEWVFYAHNVGDYAPPNSDTPIESDISTMPLRLSNHRSGYNILVPVCNQAGNFWKSKNGVQSWGIRFIFYHGMYSDVKTDGSFTDALPYPYASCHNLALSGTPSGEWTLPYRNEYAFTNDGAYDYWWKDWLKVLAIQDFRTFTLALPIIELKKFSFSDIIFINNVFFIVQSAKEVLPYKGLIEMKMKRIY